MTTPRWLQDRMTRTSAQIARIKRELRFTVTYRDAKRLERELKEAQIEHAHVKHWVTLSSRLRMAPWSGLRVHLGHQARPGQLLLFCLGL
jgi:hypothetical protein